MLAKIKRFFMGITPPFFLILDQLEQPKPSGHFFWLLVQVLVYILSTFGRRRRLICRLAYPSQVLPYIQVVLTGVHQSHTKKQRLFTALQEKKITMEKLPRLQIRPCISGQICRQQLMLKGNQTRGQ